MDNIVFIKFSCVIPIEKYPEVNYTNGLNNNIMVTTQPNFHLNILILLYNLEVKNKLK